MSQTIITTVKDFFQTLTDKVIIWRDSSFTPNMSGKTIHGKRLDFSKYIIPSEEFEQILHYIVAEKLYIYPKESMMGWIEGYYIYDINMLLNEKEFLFAFSKDNLPAGQTLEGLFPLCHTEQNQNLLHLLKKETPIKKNFDDYDY